MLKEQIRFENSTCFEGMTSIRAILRGIDSKINSRSITKILYDKNKYKKIAKEVSYLKAVSSKYSFIVEESDGDTIDKNALGTSHGGIIAFGTDRFIPHLSSLFTSDSFNPRGFYCMIQGIEDPYNFGYSIRSLYACGCDGIILDKRNWMTAAGVVCRSSAGASEMIAMYTSEIGEMTDLFRERNFSVICADERTDNILGECELKTPLVLLIGGEKRGISQHLIQKADTLVKIDYARDFRASLSAASATTMFAYEIMRQNKKR